MKKNKLKLIAVGGAVGLVNGFLGGGGGVFVVVALTLCLGFAQKNAHATAILIILPISICSAIIYIANGFVDWKMTLFAATGVVIGGVVGAFLLKKAKNNWLRLAFAFVLMLAGVRMFF